MLGQRNSINNYYIFFMFMFTIIYLSLFCFGKIPKIKELPSYDRYFDRIYQIQMDNNKHFLRVYCKEKNMISLSITEQLQFQQYPRFPVHSSEMETPRMQRRIYTFFQNCGVDLAVNQQGNIITLLRSETSDIIFTIKSFDWRLGNIQILTEDYSTKWGLGQRFQQRFSVHDGTWTIWNRDRPWEIDHGQNGKSTQTYGHQPVYLAKSTFSNKNFHLVYFKNTHGLNFESKDNSNKIKYNVVGGHIHFIIITGTHPQQVVKQYHHYIGAAMVPPFWSLGYHQSRWGYRNLNQLQTVVSQFEKYRLPLDTMWSDLDYMDKKAIFTVDKHNYPPDQFREFLGRKRINYIPLIDAGVSILDQVAIEQGNKKKIFLKSIRNQKQNYIGTVWPGRVHFVDYLHPNSTNYWQQQLNRLYQQIPFSGVWLDMNEPSNFQGNQQVIQNYRIQNIQSINMMTIDVNLNHYCRNCKSLKHQQVHAYFGHLSTIPTYTFLKKKNQRPFIITRSNSVGTGVYAGHWTGDNVADWSFLRLSISGNFLFQIFGMQMVGADICGFHKNTNQQLCSRWMQVGSFYPFARNHNQNQSISQQPYKFGNKLLQTTKLSFYQRYSLLKQMYSTLLQINGTGTFYRPLFFQFPEDSQAYLQQFVQTQFLIGDYLLGAPIVQQGKQTRQVYFPKSNLNERWYELSYSLNEGIFIPDKPNFYRSSITIQIRNQLPSTPPTFLRSGKLIFANKPVTRTIDLDNRYSIIAALNETDKRSKGSLIGINNFNDNAQIDACVEKGCLIQFQLYQQIGNNFVLQWIYKGNAFAQIDIKIENVTIVDEDRIYKSKKRVVINSKQGRQVISIL